MSPIRALRGTLTYRLTSGAVGSFHPRNFPAVARRNYATELRAMTMLSVGRAVIEGSILGVIVKLAYTGVVPEGRLNIGVAVIAGIPAMANVLSFVWARLSHGRNKLRFLVGLAIAMLACGLTLAAAPRSEFGLWMTAASVGGAWVCWSGFALIRTTIWRRNYPRAVRARITGKLATVQILVLGVLGLGLGVLMGDGVAKACAEVGWTEGAERLSLAAFGVEPLDVFRVFVVVSCLVGLVGALMLKKLHVRQQRRLMEDERGDPAQRGGPTLNPFGVFGLLFQDSRYGVYQLCQMTLGAANLATVPLLPIVLKDRFDVGYLEGILLNQVLQVVLVPVFIPVWARLLDRVHVIRFRAYHSWVFVVVLGVLVAGIALESRALLYGSSLLKGVAMAGGMLAWQLGHHDFAPPHKANQYMGVHVSLTGLRGIVAPLVGAAAYTALEASRPGSGVWAFAGSLVVCVFGALGFNALALAWRRVWPEQTTDQEASTIEPSTTLRS
ncbi:MAG: MFS transporter [Planctomycetota bacterium]